MKVLKLLAFATAMIFLTATTAFAMPGQETEKGFMFEKNKCADFDKDPIKALECRKEKVQSMLKEGKITKEEAAEKTARIDAKIAKVKEFNKLTLPQKRARLVEDFKASVDSRVKDGRLTKEKADSMIKEFNDMVAKWDGNGYPRMSGKWIKGGKHHMKEDKHNMNDKPIIP